MSLEQNFRNFENQLNKVANSSLGVRIDSLLEEWNTLKLDIIEHRKMLAYFIGKDEYNDNINTPFTKYYIRNRASKVEGLDTFDNFGW